MLEARHGYDGEIGPSASMVIVGIVGIVIVVLIILVILVIMILVRSNINV